MSTSTLLWSGEPGDLIEKIILKDISLKEGEGLEERKHELWKEISNSLDFEEISINIHIRRNSRITFRRFPSVPVTR